MLKLLESRKHPNTQEGGRLRKTRRRRMTKRRAVTRRR